MNGYENLQQAMVHRDDDIGKGHPCAVIAATALVAGLVLAALAVLAVSTLMNLMGI